MGLYKNREVLKLKTMKHYYPREMNGICVVKRKDESDEDLIKRFRKKYSKSGISKEIKDRMYFEKPSDKKRRKKAQSIRMIKREEEKLLKAKDKARRARAKKKKKEKKYDSSSKRQNYRRRDGQSENFRRDSNS